MFYTYVASVYSDVSSVAHVCCIQVSHVAHLSCCSARGVMVAHCGYRGMGCGELGPSGWDAPVSYKRGTLGATVGAQWEQDVSAGWDKQGVLRVQSECSRQP
jgi:hypothetical protein